jgi:uncharacterized membrane protein
MAAKLLSVHRSFQAAILIKGLDGVLEILGGALLLVLPAHALIDIVGKLTARELAEDPNSWFAGTIKTSVEHFAGGTQHFAALYLFTHGVVKVFLVTALWREQRWAFPVAIAFQSVFVAYELYRFTHTHSIALLAFACVDALVGWLIWREFRATRSV